MRSFRPFAPVLAVVLLLLAAAQAGAAPALVAPANGATVPVQPPRTFAWTLPEVEANDQLIVSRSPAVGADGMLASIADITALDGEEDNQVELMTDLPAGTYYWQVFSYAAGGNQYVSPTWSFVLPYWMRWHGFDGRARSEPLAVVVNKITGKVETTVNWYANGGVRLRATWRLTVAGKKVCAGSRTVSQVRTPGVRTFRWGCRYPAKALAGKKAKLVVTLAGGGRTIARTRPVRLP